MSKRILFFLTAGSLMTILIACSKDRSEGIQDFVPVKSSVALEEAVSPQGCLSVPLYLQQIRALNPQLGALEISKKIDFSSKKNIRHNFETLTAFGTFQFSEISLSKLQEQPSLSQNACESLTVTDADGESEIYLVKEKSRERLVAQSESGQRLTYHWISPQQMEVTTRYISYDLPCGSEQNPIFVEQTKIYDWSQSRADRIPPTSPLSVDRSYLERISEATGKNIADFYFPDVDAEGNAIEVLMADQLRSVPSLSPRAELLQCSAPSDPIAPPPEDDSNGGDELPDEISNPR